MTLPAYNLLLASLPEDEGLLLVPALEAVAVHHGQILCEPFALVRHVYFPDTALVSLLAVTGRSTLEVGTVGAEGLVGAAIAFGRARAQVRAIVLREGKMRRASGAAFLDAFRNSPALQATVHQHNDRMLAQAILVAACSRFHVLESRLARLLMEMHDRLQSRQFHLTHEALAQALGVRRVGVTRAAGDLQQQGLINYTRGNIEIIDAASLAAQACTCYRPVLSA